MHFSTRAPSYTTRHNIVHIPNQMRFFKVNSQTTSCNNTAGNYLISIAKVTIKTIDYENVPLERVEKALSPLVQVKSIGQPSGKTNEITARDRERKCCKFTQDLKKI